MRRSLSGPLCRLLVTAAILGGVAACGPDGGPQRTDRQSTTAPIAASGSGGTDEDSANSASSDTDSDSDSVDAGEDNGTTSNDAHRDAEDTAAEELEDETYEDVRGSADCTEDCSGHDAGWEWAKQHKIYDPDNCGGDSESFIEGCKAYAEEVQSRSGQ